MILIPNKFVFMVWAMTLPPPSRSGCIGMEPVEVLKQFRRVRQVSLGLPAVLFSPVAFPFDIVLQPPSLHPGVQYFLHLIFLFSFLCYNWRGRYRFTLEIVIRFEMKKGGMEDWVDLHGLGQLQLV